MIIEQNKKNTLLCAVITLVAFIMLLCIVVFDLRKLPHEADFLLDNAIAYWVFRGICFVFCFPVGAGGVYLFGQLFSKEPLAQICDEYFYDNSSAIALGKIAWSDMERVYVKNGFLNIELKNPNAYIAKKNWIAKLLIKGNAMLGYGDVCMSTQRFKNEGEKFLSEFVKRKAIDPN